MSEELVLREDHGGVTVLTLNRPERRNAWTVAMQGEYYGLLEACAEDGAVRCIVVTGAGNTFCPGADTNELQVYTQTGDFNPEMSKIAQPDWYPMMVPKPMIAAINGAAAGFGLVQTMMCDVRIAVPGARMSTAFARRGLPALHSASYLLPRLIGMSRAAELLISGRTFTTDEAAAIGLIHQIVPAEGFMAAVLDYAADLAVNCSPASVNNIKEQLRNNSEQTFLDAVHDAEGREHDALASVDFHEGVMSFVERRPPVFAPLGEGSRARPLS